jgi:hypothetical protein
MELTQYSENIQRQLVLAAEPGGDEARAMAERLVAPLDAAIRLTIQEALAVAAEEITLELAPGSVELRLRGRELDFAVTPPPVDAGGQSTRDSDHTQPSWQAASAGDAPGDGDEGGMLRINLRLPDRLKTRVEQAAGREGLSVNAWLVRAAAAALERTENTPQERRPSRGAQRYTGWAR